MYSLEVVDILHRAERESVVTVTDAVDYLLISSSWGTNTVVLIYPDASFITMWAMMRVFAKACWRKLLGAVPTT